MKTLTRIQAFINGMRTDEEGATAVEYGLMVSLIAVVVIATVSAIGIALNTKFGLVQTAITP